ncbi:MAG TPA: DUF1579 domain-containing protein [Pyrinomonadaceae bacterium]|nr:DUF1579 domain-containing protein [Pyrinomonadaceae bacterium]
MKFAESLENGPHANLAMFAGEWTGTTKTWFEPDVVADESPMTGTIKVILGGRFLLHEYSGSLQGKPFDGLAIFGFDIATNKFQMAWVDSFHMSTGIMFSEGDAGDKFSAFGTYFTGPDTPRWGWRTEIEQIDDDNIVITAYNVEPDSADQIATETRYTRKV